MAQGSASAGLWLEDEWPENLTRRLSRAVLISLALHLGALVVVTWVRLPQHGERPLASIEISLASVAAPPIKVPEASKPQPKVEFPQPAPPMKTAPAPAPAKPSNDVMGDVMKRVDLPPDAPKFGDISPNQSAQKAQLKLPDVPVVSDVKDPVVKAPDLKPQPSLTDDVNKALDEELRKLKKIELPKAAQAEALPKPMPQADAKVSSVKAVDTTLKVPGASQGSNLYLGRVKQRINSFWVAPPVDVTGQAYVAIVQFRLHRNGSVTDVLIERSSGNEYYDLAAKRAVLSAVPLPMFPPELTESHFDAHFTFTVGGSQG
jgi:colicin import membrane protein